ncbi:MAG: hypothetical protein QNJ85_16945 [Gammaproteobacteria bacterium]|nr:hypothetical protein [Gammaproteobacteria bacterium]
MARPLPPSEAGRIPCAFDSALLAGCAGCSLAEKTPVGEQIVVYCRQAERAGRCRLLLGRLRENAGFALPATRGSVPMTHGQAMQLRCGGLRGLASLADGRGNGEAIADVDEMLERLLSASGDFDGIAWERVVRAIAAWRPPGRRNRR